MNWNISRNIKARRFLYAQCQAIQEEKRKAIQEMCALDELEPMDDTEFESKLSKINKKYDSIMDKIFLKCHALEYPQIKNRWFCDFVKSFGVCESKRITAKQAAIFARYGELEHERDNARLYGLTYRCNVGNLFIKADFYGDNHHGYLTIKELAQ